MANKLNMSEADQQAAVASIKCLIDIIHRYNMSGMTYMTEIDGSMYEVVAERDRIISDIHAKWRSRDDRLAQELEILQNDEGDTK